MLVYFHKGFTMEGETTCSERKYPWSKEERVRQKIYLHTGIDGICDESEVDAEIERLTAEEFKSSGWGHDFSGWQRIVPYEELLTIAERREWIKQRLSTGKVTIEYIKDWKMSKILEKLTGEQFAQFCRELQVEPTIIQEDIKCANIVI